MLPILLAVIKQSSQVYSDFEREAIPHIDALYNFALRMTGNKGDANYLIKETYLRAFRFFDKLEPDTIYKEWLFRILRNLFDNTYFKSKRHKDKIDPDGVENLLNNIKLPSKIDEQFEKNISATISYSELSEIIVSLPKDLRTVLILCDIENFSYEKISDFVDCPVGVVQTRLYKARKIMFAKVYDLSIKNIHSS